VGALNQKYFSRRVALLRVSRVSGEINLALTEEVAQCSYIKDIAQSPLYDWNSCTALFSDSGNAK
jgi:hypothetical protein